MSSPNKNHIHKTGVVIDDIFIKHFCPDHPESPDRIIAIKEKLAADDLFSKCHKVEARKATQDEITLIHPVEMYEQVMKTKLSGEDDIHFFDGGDTYANKYSSTAVRKAIGGLIDLTRHVVEGTLDNGFAFIRPPGHHAEKDKIMGFCLFNNVAVAAQVARKHMGVKRVLIIDWDVHHGNGTQHIFEDDPSVMYFSVHRGGNFFPKTGKIGEVGTRKGRGYTVNVPFMNDAMADGDYLACFEFVLLPIARQFSPELVIVSAGFDCGEFDLIGPMKVTTLGFQHMMAMVKTLANGKVVCALEGGYTLETTANGVAGCVRVLLGEIPKPLKDKPSVLGLKDIKSVLAMQQKYWKDLRTLQRTNPKWKHLLSTVLNVRRQVPYRMISGSPSAKKQGRHMSSFPNLPQSALKSPIPSSIKKQQQQQKNLISPIRLKPLPIDTMKSTEEEEEDSDIYIQEIKNNHVVKDLLTDSNEIPQEINFAEMNIVEEEVGGVQKKKRKYDRIATVCHASAKKASKRRRFSFHVLEAKNKLDF